MFVANLLRNDDNSSDYSTYLHTFSDHGRMESTGRVDYPLGSFPLSAIFPAWIGRGRRTMKSFWNKNSVFIYIFRKTFIEYIVAIQMK